MAPFVVVALPAGRVVGAEQRALDERSRLLGRREREGVVDHPGDARRELPGQARDRSRSGAERVLVGQVGLADTDGRDPARLQLSVHVDEAGVAELAAQLALGGEAREQPVEARIERGRSAGQRLLAGERDRQDVGFHLVRRHPSDLDVHGRAMLADSPRSLRAHEGAIPLALRGR